MREITITGNSAAFGSVGAGRAAIERSSYFFSSFSAAEFMQ
jgi:hypothetical protein